MEEWPRINGNWSNFHGSIPVLWALKFENFEYPALILPCQHCPQVLTWQLTKGFLSLFMWYVQVVEQISITNNKFLYWIAMNNLISKKTSSKTSHALAHISYWNCNLGEETSEKNHQTIKTIAIHKRITFVKVRKTLFNDNGTLKKGF